MDKFIETFGTFLGGIILIFFIGIIMAFPTMWLWNWLMPDIFNLPEIGVLQAWGLSFLSGLLIKSTNVNKK